MDMHRQPAPPDAHDRLSALRSPQANKITSSPSMSLLRKWGVPGAVAAVLVAGAVVILGDLRRGEADGPRDAAVTLPVADETAELLSGEALVALSVRHGHFPPSLSRGDSVRIAVTPGADGTGETRLLPESVLVVSVDSASGSPDDVVLTVRAPVDLLPSVANAGSLHVARVEVRGIES